MVVARGSCPSCREPLVYMKVIDGDIIIVVGCHDCEAEAHFRMEEMLSSLINPNPTYDQMLVDFEPKGKPN